LFSIIVELSNSIKSPNELYLFLIEELCGASQGNNDGKQLVINWGLTLLFNIDSGLLGKSIADSLFNAFLYSIFINNAYLELSNSIKSPNELYLFLIEELCGASQG
jgi:hypothetical protein